MGRRHVERRRRLHRGKHGKVPVSYSSASSSSHLLECNWLWAEVSRFLDLRSGQRTRLRLLCSLVADAVVDSLCSETDDVWLEDCFGGLLPELLAASPVSEVCKGHSGNLQQLSQALGSPTVEVKSHNMPMSSKVKQVVRQCAKVRTPALRSIFQEDRLQKWMALVKQFPAKGSSARILFGGSCVVRDGVADDVTNRINKLAPGTLVELGGNLVISNCFNSITQLSGRLEGMWFLRSSSAASLILERFGDPCVRQSLGEYCRFHGSCSLPYIDAEWSYIVNVSKSDGNSETIAEILRHNAADDPIQHISLPSKLAAKAYQAVVVSEDSEALLLLWTTASAPPVPVRLAIYNAARGHEQKLTNVVDVVPLGMGSRCATPPSTTGSLGTGIA